MTIALLVAALTVSVGLALRPSAPARAAVEPSASPESRQPRRLRLPRPAGLPPGRRPVRRVPAADPMVLAAWCDALARSVRGGNTIRHAIATVAPPPSVLGTIEPIRHALDRGAALADALDSTLDLRRTPPHVDLVLVVLRACAEHGGAAGEPIDRCAAALRQRAALLAERQSQSAQARMSALVMTLLPVALLAVLVLSSEPVRRAVATPFGAAIVGLGGAVNAVGWWWMRRLITGGARWH